VASSAQNQPLSVQPDVTVAIARRVIAAVLALLWMTGSSAAQDAIVPGPLERTPGPSTEAASIARIREALAREPILVIRQPTFRTGITERRPTSFDLTENSEPLKEPPIWNAGWHNEFLTMVTPPEFRTWQAFTNTDLLQISATSLAAALAGKATGAVSDWRRSASEAEAREEVDRALEEFLATKSGATPEVVSPR
jgi:hypothetical protein